MIILSANAYVVWTHGLRQGHRHLNIVLRIDDDRRAQSSFPESDRHGWIIQLRKSPRQHSRSDLGRFARKETTKRDTCLSEFCPASPAFLMVDEGLIPLLC